MTLRLSVLLWSWLAVGASWAAEPPTAEPESADPVSGESVSGESAPAELMTVELPAPASEATEAPVVVEPATPVTATASPALPEGDEESQPAVRIADPYVDLHTGPGRGFPIFQVVERGGLIQLLKRRTDWFLVRSPRGHEGWVHRDQLLRTLTIDGEAVDIAEANQSDFASRKWETGVMAGMFENADVISVYGAWGFTENLSVELTLAHVMGDFSNAEYATLHLTHQAFPDWWISPYFQLGTGYIQTDPSATIIQTEDRREQLTHVGVGARTYLTRRFVFRVEYNNYVVLTDRNDNEKVEEWKAGFSLFF
jgi:hypothetical protein